MARIGQIGGSGSAQVGRALGTRLEVALRSLRFGGYPSVTSLCRVLGAGLRALPARIEEASRVRASATAAPRRAAWRGQVPGHGSGDRASTTGCRALPPGASLLERRCV